LREASQLGAEQRLQLLSLTGVDLTSSLVDLMRHPDADLRIQVALALGTQAGPEAVNALMLALDDEDMNVRFHAIEALGKLGPAAAVERLAAIAESHDFFLAFPALDALSRISDAAVAPRLVPLLRDDLVGAQAAEALGQLGDEEAVAPLVEALDRSQSSPESIVDALVAIHRRYAEMFSGGGEHIEESDPRRHLTCACSVSIDAPAGPPDRPCGNLQIVLGPAAQPEVKRALALARHPARKAGAARGDRAVRGADGDRLIEQRPAKTPRPRGRGRGSGAPRPTRGRSNVDSVAEKTTAIWVAVTAALAHRRRRAFSKRCCVLSATSTCRFGRARSVR
jgi:hypothetical protein